MKKAALMVILVIVVAVVISCSVNPFRRSPAELISRSPNKTYRIHLQDRKEGDHIVRFDATKGDQTLIQNEIFFADSHPFIYPELKYLWTAENVLRFGEFDPSVKPDEISIMNNTDRVVRYLKIEAQNTYLLLDVEPHSTTRLFPSPQTDKQSDISWVEGFGKFADGANVASWGMNFHVRGKYISPAHYCVSILDREVVVQSKEFEGFDTDQSGKTVERPTARNPFCY